MIVALIKSAVLHNDHRHLLDLILAVAFYAIRRLSEENPVKQGQQLILLTGQNNQEVDTGCQGKNGIPLISNMLNGLN
jgi:hypothetical protein